MTDKTIVAPPVKTEEENKRKVRDWAVKGGIDWAELSKELDGKPFTIGADEHMESFSFRPSIDRMVGHIMLPVIKESGLLLWKTKTLTERFERVFIDTATKEGRDILNGARFFWKRTLESMPFDNMRGIRLKEDGFPAGTKSPEHAYPVREDFFGSDGGSTVSGTNPDSEFISILGGPYAKQQYLYDFLDAHAKCFQIKNQNPLAKQIVDVVTNYSLGKGVKVQFKNAELQAKWDAYEKRTQFQERQRADCDQLTWGGEVMTQFTKDAAGCCAPTQIDVSTITEIVTNPRNINEVWYYHQQYATQFQTLWNAKAAGVAHNPPASEYVINEIPADQMIHTKINAVVGEKRGRSDLFPVLGWLKFFKDFYTAAVVQAQAQASYWLKKKVKGNNTDVTTFAADPMLNTTPPPGSTFVENEAVDTTFMGSTSGALRANDNAGEAIRSIIATGCGLAPEHLGVGGGSGSRAQSLTKAEPAARKFENRQWVMELHIRKEVDYWVANDGEALSVQKQMSTIGLAPILKALKTGQLKSAMALLSTALGGSLSYQEDVDHSYEVFFPDINTEDRSATLKDLYTAFSFGTYSHEAVSRKVAKLVGDTSYDYQAEQEQRRQEQLDANIKPMFALLPPWGGGAKPADGGAAPAPAGSSQSKVNYKATATDPATA